jgi:hypothetical protein
MTKEEILKILEGFSMKHHELIISGEERVIEDCDFIEIATLLSNPPETTGLPDDEEQLQEALKAYRYVFGISSEEHDDSSGDEKAYRGVVSELMVDFANKSFTPPSEPKGQ